MKTSIISLALFFISTIIVAQSKIETTPAVLNSNEKEKLEKVLSSYELLSFETSKINNLLKQNPGHFETQLTINSNLQWNLVLEENEIRAPDYKSVVTTDQGDYELPMTKCNTYKGYINGDPEQIVRLYIDENQFSGMIYDKKFGYYFINSVGIILKQDIVDTRFVVYKLDDVIEKDWQCSTEPLSDALKKAQQTANAKTAAWTPCWILEVATEADFEYTNMWPNPSTANGQILGNMNIVDGVYNSTFSIRIMVTFQHAWGGLVDVDPYTSVDPSIILDTFKNHWNIHFTNVKRDWAHLYTSKDMGSTGGKAFQGTICNLPNFSYGLSSHHFFINSITAHEIGHGMGADHATQANANCNTSNATIMCSASGNLLSFSSESVNQINYYTSYKWQCMAYLENLEMSGPSEICTQGTGLFQYSINVPAWVPITWTSSNPSLLHMHPDGAVTKSDNTGQALITATVTVCGSTPIIFTKYVMVGPPPAVSMNITGVAPYGAVDVVATNFSNVTYSWYRDNVFLQNTAGNSGTLNGGSCGTNHYLTVQITNSCGSSTSSPAFYSYPCSFMSVYPNPTNDILTFEFASDVVKESLPQEIKLFNEQSICVRSLNPAIMDKSYFTDGNKLLLNVRDLPKGTYYLHVFPTEQSGKDKEVIRILLQ